MAHWWIFIHCQHGKAGLKACRDSDGLLICPFQHAWSESRVEPFPEPTCRIISANGEFHQIGPNYFCHMHNGLLCLYTSDSRSRRCTYVKEKRVNLFFLCVSLQLSAQQSEMIPAHRRVLPVVWRHMADSLGGLWAILEQDLTSNSGEMRHMLTNGLALRQSPCTVEL